MRIENHTKILRSLKLLTFQAIVQYSLAFCLIGDESISIYEIKFSDVVKGADFVLIKQVMQDVDYNSNKFIWFL